MKAITGYNVRLKNGTFKRLKFIAKKNRRSLNMQITLLIEQLINDFEKVNGKITNEELESIDFDKYSDTE